MCKKLLLPLIFIMLLSFFCACAGTGTKETTDDHSPKTSGGLTENTSETINEEEHSVTCDPDAPIAYFSFDELSKDGKFKEDKSDGECTSVGSPALTEGKNGNALLLDGKSYLEYLMELPKDDQEHSIAAWIKLDFTKMNNTSDHLVAGWGSYQVLNDTRLMVFHNQLCVTSYSILAVKAICVDVQDRIYAATELGIQSVRSYGLIDAIIPLPGSEIPDEIAFGGQNKSYLYARCGDTVYRRKWNVSGRADELTVTTPKNRSYYD